MASENTVQTFVHALEEGGWVGKVRFALLMAAIIAVYCILVVGQFRGLSHAKAMDQAQIARELASGNGFTTQFIRPRAMLQFMKNKGAFPLEKTPDTYHAPLNPWINSLALRYTKNTWHLTDKQFAEKNYIYPSDRMIAGVSMFFFVLSVGVNFTIAKRLFDRRLALLGMGLMLVCDVFWKYSLSGLPQMLMLLIFSGCTYTLVRALEAREAGKNALWWLLLTAVGFGLLALAHGITIWIFAGALLFVEIAFWPREGKWWARLLKNPAPVMLIVFLLIYSPWLVRNYLVCGDPFGVSWYSILFQIRGSESEIMRSSVLDLINVSPVTYRNKLQWQTNLQLSGIYGFLGHSLVALVFFVALLHLFKKPTTAVFRWAVLLMWLFAVLGMAVFGLEEEGEIHANDLHVLFIPTMIFYGLAFVLVLWSRLAAERPRLNIRFVNIGFVVLIYVISALPLTTLLIASSKSPVQWPPYAPPFIAQLANWTNENETIASDMPWGVAWYADRKSLWLPMTLAEFLKWSDYDPFNGTLIALYLTPVTGDQRMFSDIWKGEYKEWAPFILRTVNVSALKGFPLRAATALQIEGGCVIYADRARWLEKTD